MPAEIDLLLELLALADLFEREGNGPRDVLCGRAPGGPWGADFCNRVAMALRSAASAPTPPPANPSATVGAPPSCPLSELIRVAQGVGLSDLTVWPTSEGFQANARFGDNGWRVAGDPLIVPALINCLMSPEVKKRIES